MMKLMLPLSKEAVREIAKQVTMRDQPERVGLLNGRAAVDLSDVIVVAMPELMMKEH